MKLPKTPNIRPSYVAMIRHTVCVEVMFSPLSFCLWAGYLITLWTDSDEIFWIRLECDKDQIIIFWWRSGFGDSNCKSDSSPLSCIVFSPLSKSCGRIQTKLGGQVGCAVTRTKWFDFGEDPNLNPDMRIFKFFFLSDSSTLRDGAKNDVHYITIFQKFVDKL